MKHGTKLAGLVAGQILISGFAFGQQAPSPDRITETYDAWTVECTKVAAAKTGKDDSSKKKTAKKDAAKPGSRLICEASQTFSNKKSGNEVAKLAFAVDSKKKDALVAVFRTMVDVSFGKTPALTDGDEQLASGKFVRCSGNYCYIVFDVSVKNLEAILQAKKPGIQYPIASNRVIRINIESKGLAEAIAALKSRK